MNTIKKSYTYRLITSFIVFLETAIKNSYIFSFLTKDINNSQKIDNSYTMKLIYKIISIIRKIFVFLKLDKLLKDSIFAKTHIWIAIVIALAPFLPTMVILAGAMGVLISFLIKICLMPNFKFKYTPVNMWVGVFFLVYIIFACLSLAPMSSVKIAGVVGIFILMYFAIINSIETRKQLNTMLYIFVSAGFIVSIYGIYQFVAGTIITTSWVDANMLNEIKARIYSTFENPNVLGEYLLLVIPICISLFFANKNLLGKIFMAGMAVVMIICLALTYSRGCYLGILVAAVIFALLLNIRFILLLIAGIISLPFVLPKSIISRFTSIGNMSDSSTKYRISIWTSSWEVIKDYWYRPIGQGAEAFNKVYPLYAQSGVGTQHAHNWFLQTTIETGIIGILSILICIFRAIQYLFNGIKKAVHFCDKIVLIGFVSGIFGFLVQSIFDNTWYNYRVVLIFWIFIGLAVRAKKFIDEEERLLDDKSNEYNK